MNKPVIPERWRQHYLRAAASISRNLIKELGAAEAKVAELKGDYQTLLDDAVDMRAKVAELEAEVERLTR